MSRHQKSIELESQISRLLAEWHFWTKGRPKTAAWRYQYVSLDENGFGPFVVRISDGAVCVALKYGNPHKGKFIGYIQDVTGEQLIELRYRRPSYEGFSHLPELKD